MTDGRPMPDGTSMPEGRSMPQGRPMTPIEALPGDDPPLDAQPAATEAPEAQPLVRLEGLQVWFPIRGGIMDQIRRRPLGYVHAVDGIDLDIRQGEVLALVGESGSGKTTTGRVVVRLTKPTGGRMLFEGEDSIELKGAAAKAYRLRVQLIFQDPYETLDPKQTVGDFVAEPLAVNGLAKEPAEREARVSEALEATGLRPASDFMFRYPHELSGGQRQRVVIAGALVLGPTLVVADEPVSMLDVSIRTELLSLMLDLRKERGLTYLFITHDLSLAWVIADRIAVMYLGKILEIGPAEAVIHDPRNPYTRALVSVLPTPEPPDVSAGARRSRIILQGETPDAAFIPEGCRFNPRCPLAFDRCRKEEPPLFDQGGGHASACWLVEGGTPLPIAVARSVADTAGPPEPSARLGDSA